MQIEPVILEVNNLDKFLIEMDDIPSELVHEVTLPYYKRTWYGIKKWKPITLWVYDIYENNISDKLIRLLKVTFPLTIKILDDKKEYINKEWYIPEATIYDLNFGLLSWKENYIREIQVILKYKEAFNTVYKPGKKL